MSLARRIVRVSGVVQGVGFRPFVYRAASRHRLAGSVCNSSGSVVIDLEGDPSDIQSFLAALTGEAPELARIASVSSIEADPTGARDFCILESRLDDDPRDGAIPADVAICHDCLRETADPADRRNLYPFTNCTNCGPRFTIVRGVPYDRGSTTMSGFPMCEDCLREYRDPSDRRFHAEPIACPVCGPSVWLEKDGQRLGTNVFEVAGRLLEKGEILAIKGLGGFHLACDARNERAVDKLRTRKGRRSKPFALMVRDIEEARALCELDDDAVSVLASRSSPIVIAKAKRRTGIAASVAPGPRPGNLGVMLPYTPLHSLLFGHSPRALVMTSGNLSEEPLVFTNSSARERLATLADAYLMHNRDIHVPCDDSVVRLVPAIGTVLLRRARGYVPEAIPLPLDSDCILGVGGEQKNTFSLARGSRAVPSQHIGDLDTTQTLDYFEYAIDHLKALLRQSPKTVACDLHPGYLSTQYARRQQGVEVVEVQHHHAHIASCLAENGRTDRCIGLALDGTGYGIDGTVWGGEFLLADLAGFQRVGHFAQVRMPGGEAAIRDPKRMALAYLHAAYGDDYTRVAGSLGLALSEPEMQAVDHQLRTGLNSPLTSSAGRLFDAVSAAIGVCREMTYEGQPAAELELTVDDRESGCYGVTVDSGQWPMIIDTLSVFRAAVEDKLSGVSVSVIAGRFHNALITALVRCCAEIRSRTSLNAVALSGGVFQNAVILTGAVTGLSKEGFEVLIHKKLPPNDGCISFGQVAVAAASRRQQCV